MTAQQQLAELLKDQPSAIHALFHRTDCAEFLREHGPAIAELIQIASGVLHFLPGRSAVLW